MDILYWDILRQCLLSESLVDYEEARAVYGFNWLTHGGFLEKTF